jgi:two-component system, chemotaxis family, sensor kinase CheA
MIFAKLRRHVRNTDKKHMLDEPLNQKLLNLFAAEAKEELQAIIQSCLLMEQNPDMNQRAELARDILRHAHTLKGSARSLGLEDIATLTHSLESVFQHERNTGFEFKEPMFDLIYLALDGISSLAASGPSHGISTENVLERLKAAVENDGAAKMAAVQPSLSENALPGSETSAGQETIRITVERLDAIFNMVNELQVTRLSMERNLVDMQALVYGTHSTAALPDLLQQRVQFADLLRNSEVSYRSFNQLLAHLQEQVRQARMLPLSIILKPLQRTARDLGRRLGKEVALHLEGEDIELDRSVIEQIKSPLQHLLSNSIDHGLETPEKRRAARKPEIGSIIIRASQNGSSILIEFIDDGAGINLASVKEHAVRCGLKTSQEAAQLHEQDALRLLFQPGFSLAGFITNVSGRGVGLDVVRQTIEAMQGEISVENDPGKGIRFSLNIPVSIATTLCLFVQINGQIFALPARNVIRLARIPAEIAQGQDPSILIVEPEDEPVPTVSLRHLIKSDQQPAAPGNQRAVIVGSPDQPVALFVDDFHDVQEIVIKELPLFFTQIRWLAGAAISSTGEVILVLNTLELARTAGQGKETKGARQ